MALLPDVLPAEALELRRWHTGIVDDVMAAISVSFAELHHWMPWASVMPTRQALWEVLDAGDRSFATDEEWQYVLWASAEDSVVGGAGLHRRAGPDTLEIGYWVRSDRTRLGYATVAARVLTDAAFKYVPGIDRVEIHMDQANHASAAIPPKLGYTLVREDNRDVLAAGHTGRSFVWAITRADRRR